MAKNHQIITGIGARRAIDLAVRLPKHAWQRLSAGRGSKGERWYDWALVQTTDEAADPAATSTGHHWLLIRRNRTTGQYASYRAYSPTRVRLKTLVRVAGQAVDDRRVLRREQGTGRPRRAPGPDLDVLAPMDRPRDPGPRIPIGHAYRSCLSVMAATQPTPADGQTLIPFTRNEIRRLLTAAIAPILTPEHVIHWSTSRRQHQARARISHYTRRAAGDE